MFSRAIGSSPDKGRLGGVAFAFLPIKHGRGAEAERRWQKNRASVPFCKIICADFSFLGFLTHCFCELKKLFLESLVQQGVSKHEWAPAAVFGLKPTLFGLLISISKNSLLECRISSSEAQHPVT